MAATNTAAAAATAQVIGTAELLEHVLSYLPLFDLYAVQRVNRTFQATISGSRKLRQLMHLETSDYEAIEVLLGDQRTRNLFSPMYIVTPLSWDDASYELRKHELERTSICFFNVVTMSLSICYAHFWNLRNTARDASWRKIRIGPPDKRVWLGMSTRALERLEAEYHGEKTLGALVDYCSDFWLDKLFNEPRR
ncbi:hypothetical protein HII31_06309 [Pseudocercospora fuligena]|uniref:F-box domain-containing protein n=1 Tax=Pseudocercospora fuligena TaxID=685502 RepID=A0A8H6RKJ5_9PEZI|nr:hypothetical protein HII31_06309 [Pseudocercospora fuligena]